MQKLNKLGVALGLLLFALPVFATDLAILRNGFTVRHERRENLGTVTRLYMGAGNSSYVDIETAQIERFEKDQSQPVPPVAVAVATPSLTPSAPKPQSLNEVINTISDRHHIDPDFISSVIHAESGFNPARGVSQRGARADATYARNRFKSGRLQFVRSAGQCRGRHALSERTAGAL